MCSIALEIGVSLGIEKRTINKQLNNEDYGNKECY